METRSQRQLLELTRCGLWGGEPDTTLFDEGIDWVEVLRLAKEQTLLGVISTAIERLPLLLRPPRSSALRLHQMVALNRQYYAHHAQVLAKLIELVARAGVERPVLLKGLGVGLNYPDPTLRQCGDIDLYVGEAHYRRVWDRVCEELGAPQKSHSDHHFDFELMGTSIEIHRYATAPSSVAFRSREFTEWSRSQLEGEALRRVTIQGVEVYLPSYNFDFIFIFYHTWRHFLMGGVGLRQFCDWACYATVQSGKIDRAEVERIVSLCRLERSISLFATIAVRALGAAPDKFLGYATEESDHWESVLGRVWSRGNFGYYNVDLQRRSRGWLARKGLGMVAMFWDMCYLMTIDWRYALRFYASRFVGGIRLALRGV